MTMWPAKISKPRQANFELLRIVSMIFILIHHCIMFTGQLAPPRTVDQYVIWLLEIISVTAVNCYVLITGYFLAESTFKISKVFRLWLQVAFYAVSIGVIGAFLNVDYICYIRYIVFPIMSNHYWFVSSYLGLFLLSPILNALLHGISKRMFQYLLIVLTLLLCVVSYVSDAYGCNNGFSLIWFIYLYMLAAYIRLYSVSFRSLSLGLLLGCVWLGTFLFKYLLVQIGYEGTFRILSYNSVNTLVGSCVLFLLFKNLKLSNSYFTSLVLFCAPLTFSVYLIHDHIMVRDRLFLYVENIINMSQFHFIPILLLSLSIYVICIGIDYFRLLIFRLIPRLRLLEKIDSYFILTRK